MRIVNLETFRSLPAGTLFRQCSQPFAWHDWSVKGETWETDFLSAQIGQPAWTKDFDAEFDMLENGKSHRMDISYGRDGLFEPNAIFQILEEPDLLLFRNLINTALTVAAFGDRNVHSAN